MKKLIITIVTTATLAMTLQAQAPRIGYFMDKYSNRHQRNPALSPAWGYVNFLPVLGAVDFGIQSNLKLSDFVYPVSNDKLGTFLHPEVSIKEVSRNLGNMNHMGLKANINVLGFGFYTRNDRFWSFDLNVKAEAGMGVPKDFFMFFKEGMSGNPTTYELIENMNVVGRAYGEAAFGYAQDLNEDMRVGAKLKVLVGGADARLLFEEGTLMMSQDLWRFNMLASGTVLGNGFSQAGDSIDVGDLFDYFEPGIGGYGGAIDLGVSYNLDNLLGSLLPMLPLKGFTASLGITDLGFIRYSEAARIEMGGTVEFEGARIQYVDSLNFDIGNIEDQVSDLTVLRTVPMSKGVSRGLRTTTNLGLEYSFLNDKMSAGLLYSMHFGYPRVFSDLTLSYNLRPWEWFSFSLATTMMQGFFRSAGFAMNLTPRYGLTFFLSAEYLPFARTPGVEALGGIPLPIHSSNFHFHFGMTMPFGGKNNRHHKYEREKHKRAREIPQTTIEEVIIKNPELDMN